LKTGIRSAKRADFMFRSITYTICAVLVAPTAIFGQNPFRTNTPTYLERTIPPLVEQLAAGDYREREKASKAIFALGEAAKPQLKKIALNTPNPEVERRIEVLIAKWDRERLIQPKTVTFQGTKTISGLISEINRQTGYRIGGTAPDEKQTLKVDWKNTTFWVALDEICSATGLQPMAHNQDIDGSSIGLDLTDCFDPHICYAGPYRIVATNFNSNKNLQLSGLPRKVPLPVTQGSLGLNFQIWAEPKNPLVGVGNITIKVAEDDRGTNLILARPNEDRVSGYTPETYRGLNQYFSTEFGKPSKDATNLRRLKGTVGLYLLTETRPLITVEKLTTQKSKKFVSRMIELEIHSVSESSGGSFSVSLTAKKLQPNSDDYTWSQTIFQRIEVYDEDGEKYVNGGTNDQAQGPGVITMTIMFNSPEGRTLGKPAKLVLVEWFSMLRDVDFEFENIPLP
jgi:hypothetical protein